jgi:hypothetical protein
MKSSSFWRPSPRWWSPPCSWIQDPLLFPVSYSNLANSKGSCVSCLTCSYYQRRTRYAGPDLRDLHTVVGRFHFDIVLGQQRASRIRPEARFHFKFWTATCVVKKGARKRTELTRNGRVGGGGRCPDRPGASNGEGRGRKRTTAAGRRAHGPRPCPAAGYHHTCTCKPPLPGWTRISDLTFGSLRHGVISPTYRWPKIIWFLVRWSASPLCVSWEERYQWFQLL